MSKHAIGTVVAAMNELYAVLLSWAITISGYSAPADEPKVVMVPHAHLVRSACGGHECKVLGWFPPGETIYLDNRLDPNESMYASSILVHEFVHYLQQESGRLDAKSSCETALAMEREAYAVQREFLTRNGAFYPVGASIHVVGCEPVVRNEMTAASKRPMTEHSSNDFRTIQFMTRSLQPRASMVQRPWGARTCDRKRIWRTSEAIDEQSDHRRHRRAFALQARERRHWSLGCRKPAGDDAGGEQRRKPFDFFQPK